ncbi:hypothetical protein B0H34DRAFT_808691 [Crassisporium funariophilum]|nr:hypothetical protein B0H34DRAFT_808691 [Crassisporium funariophilum]
MTPNMSTVPALQHFLVVLHRILSRILKPDLIRRALRKIIRHLAFLWSLLRSRVYAGRGKQSRLDKPPPTDPSRPATNVGEDEGLDGHRNLVVRKQDESTVPNDTPDVEIIQIDSSIACSLYPYGSGMRNASKSSQMVNASRSNHNLEVSSRHGSRSSQFLDSNCSNSIHTEEYTFELQRSPVQLQRTPDEINFRVVSPTPRAGYSVSSPHLMRPESSIIEFPLRARSASPHGSIEHIPLGDLSVPKLRTHDLNDPPSDLMRPEGSIIAPSLRARSPSPHGSIERIPLGELSVPKLRTHDLDDPPSKLKAPLNQPHIYAIIPENFQRYEKRRRIQKVETSMKVKPLTTNFIHHIDPPGWTSFIHPEGACYFYHAQKRVYTDVDLHDPKSLKQITDDLTVIEDFIFSNDVKMPLEYDLVLDLNTLDDGKIVTDYYYVDHLSRVIFFLDNFETKHLPIWCEVKGVNSVGHLRHEMEAQYWWHCLTYPTCLDLSRPLVGELRDLVLHFIGDNMTSPYANSPYSLDELYKMLSLVDSLKDNIDLPSPGSCGLISRFMFVFSRQKFYNFYGQPEARLNRDHSVYGTATNQRTWLIKILSIFLFSAPDVHLRTLQKMWVDGLMHKSVWEQSMKKMNDEWQEFVLYATVLLNANVAFLAIQSVDIDHNPYRSPAQISSYLSVIASIGSIILGLLLVRQNRTKNRDTASDAERFMRKRSHPLLGLETLAIMFSLPYAFLMWGMVSFLTAFCFMCFQDSNPSTRALVGSLCTVIVVLIIWCIWTSWEKQPDTDAVEPVPVPIPDVEDPESDMDVLVQKMPPDEDDTDPDPKRSPLNVGLIWPAFLKRRGSSDTDETVTNPV